LLKNDITGDKLISKPANDNYRNSPFWETREKGFSGSGGCPYCKDDTEVCHNWIHGDDNKWYHECYECDGVFWTYEKIDDIPHFLKRQAS